MKAIILAIILSLMIAIPVSALDWSDIYIKFPTASVSGPVGTSYSKTFSIDTSTVTHDSCYITANYQSGECDYLSKAYIIITDDCTELSCARDYKYYDITTLNNPETITVTYITKAEDTGKELGVAAFIIKSHMTYDFTESKGCPSNWCDESSVIESTRQVDLIKVITPGAPTMPNVTTSIGAVIASIINGIKNFMCTSFNVWC